MGRVIAASRYIAVIGVVFGLVAALAAFGWGSYKTITLVVHLVHGEVDGMAVALVAVMDAFLIASGLLIFALGLYELFVGDIVLPAWLAIHDLDALKGKVAGIVILAMAVSFLERLETHVDSRDVLYSGIAVSLVSGALVLLTRLGKSH
jgi:uncharacterized membrane protein YqhA